MILQDVFLHAENKIDNFVKAYLPKLVSNCRSYLQKTKFKTYFLFTSNIPTYNI